MSRQATDVGDGRPPAIAIIGLGRTGRALGLSLQRVKTRYRIQGHDRVGERSGHARRVGAIDEARSNVADAVSDADIVFLSEPATQSMETLAAVAAHVLPGALVTATCSPMQPVMSAADRLLPPRVHYVGGHPILGPPSPTVPDDRVFEGVEYCLAPKANACADAVRVLTGLVTAIGARPYFIDAAEHDALVPAVGALPDLLDDLVTRMLGESPSWPDIRRLAPAGAVAAGLRPPTDGDERRGALAAAAPALVPWLDGLLAALVEWRDAAASSDADRLRVLLDAADEARARWEGMGAPAAADGFEELDAVRSVRRLLPGRAPRRRHDRADA